MKTFTEVEKTIARNIDKEYRWMARDQDGNLCIYEEKPEKEENSWYFGGYDYISYFNHLFSAIKWGDEEPTRIRDIYNPPILNDLEREYLKAVFKPFRNDIDYVRLRFYGKVADGQPCHISAYLRNDNLAVPYRWLDFPSFIYHEDGMYSGMVPYHDYTLEALGIYYS